MCFSFFLTYRKAPLVSLQIEAFTFITFFRGSDAFILRGEGAIRGQLTIYAPRWRIYTVNKAMAK